MFDHLLDERCNIQSGYLLDSFRFFWDWCGAAIGLVWDAPSFSMTPVGCTWSTLRGKHFQKAALWPVTVPTADFHYFMDFMGYSGIIGRTDLLFKTGLERPEKTNLNWRWINSNTQNGRASRMLEVLLRSYGWSCQIFVIVRDFQPCLGSFGMMIPCQHESWHMSCSCWVKDEGGCHALPITWLGAVTPESKPCAIDLEVCFWFYQLVTPPLFFLWFQRGIRFFDARSLRDCVLWVQKHSPCVSSCHYFIHGLKPPDTFRYVCMSVLWWIIYCVLPCHHQDITSNRLYTTHTHTYTHTYTYTHTHIHIHTHTHKPLRHPEGGPRMTCH